MIKIEDKISVALCTYNGEKYIEKQLNSILNQTISVDEIVVCDDCSVDKTITILNSFKVQFPSIFRIYSNQENLGSNKNFEKAFSLTTGEYIFFSDQDDIWKNNKIEKILKVFKDNSAAEGVFSDANFIDENSNQINIGMTLWESIGFFPPKNITFSLYELILKKGNFLTGATFCIKKNAKQFCIPFLTTNDFLHDEWLAFMLSYRKTLFYIKEPLIMYRLHENQQIGVGKIKKRKKNIKKSIKIFSDLIENNKNISFRGCKYISRSFFEQYKKYNNLIEIYPFQQFEIAERFLLSKFIEVEKLMKSKNLILYYIIKWNNKRRGKRQL